MSKDKRKGFIIGFIIFLIIFIIGIIRKELQNDTFYTIKVGESIFKNGIDMLDHFSIHEGLPYTYPHWLYDCIIYLIYKVGSFTGIYISTIILYTILVLMVFITSKKITNNLSVAAFSTFICTISVCGFATARAQLVSFIIFATEIYFIESYLISSKKRYLFGLLFLSVLLCNMHVAVWPFYFVLYLPYIAEYIIALICNKIKLKKENKFIKYLKRKFILEKNSNIKYLILTMFLSIFTGFITPIKDTPYTYIIKTMMGNSQKYIEEHQTITWLTSPFTIIMAIETIFLTFFNKAKLRDFFMICGLVLMSIISIRHMALLGLIGTICFARVFDLFFLNFTFNIDEPIIKFFKKKIVLIPAFLIVITFTTLMTIHNAKSPFIREELYPIKAVEYIKENLDIEKMRLYNEYNYGSYILLNDIKVFIDSRADLYTKEFNNKEDIFDDYYYIGLHHELTLNKYKITHLLLPKEGNDIRNKIVNDKNYELIYEDENFEIYKKNS